MLERARTGDDAAFARLVAPYRDELVAHGYRMLGSRQDAEDALQEALIGAWRGLAGFAGRSSLRTWLYRILTHACLRLAERRRRLLSPAYGPPRRATADLGAPVPGPVWMEPWMDEPVSDEPGPDARYLRREGVELAFVAALQHLPAVQRAVLILREVLEFPAAEVARMLDTTPASVNSALQRARKAVDERVPGPSQRVELAALGDEGRRELVEAFVGAWERADVAAIAELLAEDVRFTMPPLPAWFDGREDVVRFFAERVFATPWRLVPISANGQPAFACYQRDPDDGRFRLGAVNLLAVRAGRIVEIAGFIDPAVGAASGLPAELPGESAAVR
ncbi:RNA polymerase subunit sigma-70 [Pseudonocardia sp. S2-4]|uniref:RNA polymerase subunit sigma-70 n=1 Tax=Pseudonocardia humida TaxID=2800819 RepID=A0ABT1A8U3_9PSEU|nr:RNA polymerase subunit sigma-70 [Pseudonocardia humida]